MPTQVQFRRGNTTQHSTFTGAEGELTVDTEKKTVVVHDGSTAGGSVLAKVDSQSFTGNTSTSNLTVSSVLSVTGTVNTSLIPSANETYSLGNNTLRWANLYLSGNTILLGDQTISSNATGIDLSGSIFVNGTELANSTNISLGENVAITTSQITVGNSTVNTVITSSSINAVDVVVSGNLTVSGTQTVLNTQTLTVNDNIIVINDGWVGAPTEDAGIEVERGDANNVSIFWDESEDNWAVSFNNNTILAIATNTDVSTAYSNATTYASNATNISSGTLDAARLATSGVTANTYGNSSQIPVLTIDDKGRVTAANVTAVAGVTNVVYTEANTSLVVSTGDGSSFTVNFGTANSSYHGFIEVVDSIANTSDVVAAAANSVKVAYDAALNAYSNATTYSSNADNITSGTLNTARLPAVANISTEINVGSNVNLNVDRITVGNTTINTFITTSEIFTTGTLTAGNTAISGFANITSTLAAGNTTITGFANVSDTISVGANVVANTTTIKIGNGTTNTIITKNSITLGNNTVNAVVNSTILSVANSTGAATLDPTTLTVSSVNATSVSGNGVALTSLNASSIDSGTLDASRLATSGVTANTYGNSSQIPVLTIDDKGRVTAANTTAVAGVTNVVYTESNTTLVVSTGDGSSFATTFGSANSTYQGFIKVVDSTSNTDNLTAAAANSVKVAYDAALNAYSNATTYSSNADNITSGTLNTARLPATANISTSINVGANVNLAVDRINVGNSTINSYITATGIETDGTLVVANGVTFANGLAMSNTVISNVADPVNPQDAANKQYVDEVAEGLKVAPAVELATINNLTATYDNGTLGVGATLTATANGAFPTIDGITLTSNTFGQNGVLVRAQSNSAHNGRYNLTTVGNNDAAWVLTKCAICDEADEIPGSYIFVKAGTLYGGTGWVAIVADPSTFVVGTDAVNYFQFSGAGTYTAGDYLFLDGTEFNVNATSNSTASVVVARDSNQSFAANVVSVNSIAAGNGQFTGPVSGITTLAAGNTTVTGFANVTSTLAAGNTTVTGFINVSSTAALGNTTITGFANVTSTLAAGNTTVTGFINVSSTAALGNTTITGFANVSSAVYVGNSTSNVALSGGTVSVSGFQQSYVTHTSSNTDIQTCDTFNASNFRSAQYFVQLTSGTDYHTINISLVHNGTDVFISQYGEIIENTSLGTFTADVTGGNVLLKVTPTNAVTVVKAVRTLIAV